jgi:hypothetical protein
MPQIDITSSPENLEKLLQTATPELEGFDPALQVRRLVSRQRALELDELLLGSWAPLVDWIEEELSPARAEQRKTELKRLDTRGWVFYAADLAADEIHSNINRKQRRELAKVVGGHDRFLFKWATPFFGDDPEHAETLRDISRGTGLRDDAEDVLRLVALFHANWAQVKDQQTVVTEAYLEQAAADAAKQLDLLRNGLANPARKLADAAYSLWYFDYVELMHLGRYLTRRDADSTLRFPGVRELPTGGTRDNEDDEPDVAKEPDSPQPDSESTANA